jgi:hypothetical protein
MTTSRPSRLLRIAVVIGALLATLATGFAVARATPGLVLLPQGVNRVPSCEVPEDVDLWSLECPADIGTDDVPGDEPIVPVDLKSQDPRSSADMTAGPEETSADPSDPGIDPGTDTTP